MTTTLENLPQTLISRTARRLFEKNRVQIELAKDMVRALFVNDYGQPMELSDGQALIFWCVIKGKHSRISVLCPTQYGKSLVLALASIYLTCIECMSVAVVAPREEDAKRIMRYYIEHLGDNYLFYSQLERNTRLERLKAEESKKRIKLRDGGEMFAMGTNERLAMKAFESAMGAGADVVILDEAGRIRDTTEASIYRMIGGKEVELAKAGKSVRYVKVGNPFYRNHFMKTHQRGRYFKIEVDWVVAVAEGRYTYEFVEEARERPMFDVFYECKFPDDNDIDQDGWRRLLLDSSISGAQERQYIGGEVGEDGKFNVHARLGVDVGEGGDPTAFVIRTPLMAKVIEVNRDTDTMSQIPRMERYCEEYGIKWANVFIDAIGIGGGLVHRLHEMNRPVQAVKVSEKAQQTSTFSNMRAENFWGVKTWVEKGGALIPDKGWAELADIKYREDNTRGLAIEKKEDMKKRGAASPNVADALMLTFTKRQTITSDALIIA